MEYIKFKQGSPYPQKRGGSTLHCVNQNKFILIGGSNREEEFGDIWELNILDNNECEWKQINIPLSSFTPRSGHCSALVDQKSIYIYGGQNFTQNKQYDDFMQLNLETNQLQMMNKKMKSMSTNEPTERNSSTLIYNSIDKQLLLFGGADSKTPLKDLFIYDLNIQKTKFNTNYLFYEDSKEWKNVETTKGEDIQGLEMHTAHFYCSNSELKESKKKSKTQEAQNIIDITIGDFTKESDQQGNPIPHEKMVKIAKVNIEFDEKNAVIVENEDDEGDNVFPTGNEQRKSEQTQEQQGHEQEEEEKKNEQDEAKSQKDQSQKQDKQQTQMKYMIVIGGRYTDKFQSEIYALDLSTYEWKRIKDLPFSLCAHASTLVDDCIYISGGFSGANLQDKILIFSLTNQKLYECQITNEEKKSCYIEPKMSSAMSYDTHSKKLYFFGGAGINDESTSLVSIDTNKINSSKRSEKI